MSSFIFRRLILMVPTLFMISLISFVIIELPPGDYMTSYIANRMAMGDDVRQDEIDALVKQYGLDQPAPVRYTKWLGNVMQGNFGFSFEWQLPVSDLIWERLGLTVVVAFSALIFSWIVGLVIGIFSAVYQYSIGDYIFTSLSFIGLGTPNFMLALIMMWIALAYFGTNISGLFSAGICRPALELCQIWRYAQASLGARHHRGDGRIRRSCAHHARQSAR